LCGRIGQGVEINIQSSKEGPIEGGKRGGGGGATIETEESAAPGKQDTILSSRDWGGGCSIQKVPHGTGGERSKTSASVGVSAGMAGQDMKGLQGSADTKGKKEAAGRSHCSNSSMLTDKDGVVMLTISWGKRGQSGARKGVYVVFRRYSASRVSKIYTLRGTRDYFSKWNGTRSGGGAMDMSKRPLSKGFNGLVPYSRGRDESTGKEPGGSREGEP